MKLRTALPSGLVNKMCERHDPLRMGGAPPIRFVPTSPALSKEDGEEPSKVKITISTEVSKYYTIFKEGTAEDVVNLIRRHEGIISNKKLKENCDMTLALISAKKEHLTVLTNKPSQTSDNQWEVKELQEALKEYKIQVKQSQEEVFDFFEKKLDQKLVAKWRDIVKKECDSVDYIDLK